MNKGIAARWMMLFLLLFSPLMMVMTAPFAFAAQGPQTFTLDGRIKQAGTTTPILDPSVKIEVHVMNPSRTCVIYAEEQFVNTQTSNGYFNIQVGSNIGAGKRIAGVDPGLSMATVFQNTTPMTGTNVAGQTCPAGTYTPLARDSRYFRIFVTPSLAPVTDQLDDIVLDAVPTAMVAETADKVGNFGPADLLRVNTVGVQILSQANLENIFTSSNYAVLTSLLAGTSNLYNRPASNGTNVLPTIAAPTSPSAGQIWYNAGNVYFHDGAVTRTISTGSSTSVSAADGSAAAPTISFASDTNTGWYLAAPDNLAAATGGVERVRINENGNLGVGSSAPGARLTLGGNMSAPAWLFGGIGIRQNSATYNDTTSSGATSQNYINAFGIPTLTATSATTYSNASAFSLYPPVPGTNVTLTSSTGLTINSTSLAGGGGTTNGYGLQVNAPTGAANNYAATFMGGNVGIGTTAPQTKLVINANAAAPQAPNSGSHLQVSGSDNSGSSITLDAYGTNFYDSPYFTMRKAQGTAASPGSTLINDILGDVQMQGYFSGFDNGAEIVGVASENWSGTAKGTKVQISAVRRGTTSRVVSTFGDYGLAVGSSNPAASSLEINGSYSVPSWTTTGQNFAVKAATSTDTTGSGAIATRVSSSFAAPTFASSSAVTVGDAATVYIAGAPIQGANTTITRSNSLYVAAGQSYFGGNVGVGVTAPTASLHLKAGTAAAGTAPLKLTAGPVNTTAEAGAIEFDGTSLFYTDSTNTRRTLGVSGAGITALTGDVTASGAGSVVATIPNDTVTFAKMQNIATQRLLGRSTAAAGDVEELTVGTGLTITGGALNLTDTTDDDSFAALVCGNGFVPYKSGGVWTCLEARSDLVNDTLVLRGATGSFEGNQVTANSLRLNNAGAYVSINTPAAANYTLTLPADDGTTSGQVLTTNGSGVLSWSTITPGTGDFLANGTVPMTGQFDAASGTIGAPGISFAADQDTGLSTDGSNGLQFSSGGVLMATLSSVGIIMQNSGVWGSSTPGGAYIRSGAGSAAQPTYSFSADDDNGMFRVTTDTVGFSTAGSERMRIDSTGNVGINTTTPGAKLDVKGDLAISGSTSGAVKFAVPAAAGSATYTWPAAAPASNMVLQSDNTGALSWVANGSGGTGDFLANGTVPMTGAFRAAAGALATPSITFDGDTDTGFYSAGTDAFAIVAGGTSVARISTSGIHDNGPNARAFNLRNGSVTAAAPPYAFYGDNDTGFFSPAANTVGLTTNGNERLRIDSAGNVGIGTSAPSVKLDVTGTLKIGNGAELCPAVGAGGLRYNSGALEVCDGATWTALGGGGGSGDFLANGTVPMTGAFRSIAGTAGAPGMAFVGDTNNGIFAPAADNVAITTDGAERMRVTATGNVGIGTTAPTSALHVQTNSDSIGRLEVQNLSSGTSARSNVQVSGDVASVGMTAHSSANNQALGGNYGANGISAANLVRLRANSSSAFLIDTTSTAPVVFGTNNNERMRIDASGNVGIGTTAPDTRLQVAGTIRVGDGGETCAGGNFTGGIRYNAGSLQFCNGTAWTTLGSGSGSGDFLANGTVDMTGTLKHVPGTAALPGLTFVGDTNTGIYSGAADTIGFSTNGTEKARIDSAGNVGIGTTAPSAGGTAANAARTYLTIKGPTGSGVLQMTSAAADADGAHQGGVEWVDSNSSAADKRVAYIAALLSGATAGNRGSYLAFGTRADNGSASIERFKITNTGDSIIGQAGGTPQARFDIVGSTNDNTASGLSVRSLAGTSLLRVVNDGNVGIGTTAPTAKLDVVGPGYEHVRFKSNGATDSGSIVIIESFDATGRPGLAFNRTGDFAVGWAAQNYSGTLGLAFHPDNNTNNTPSVLFTTTGRVGIGTTAPDEKLVVVGNVKATSFISTSDQRLKRDITSVPGLAAITKLNGVSWSWKDSGDQDMGVIAQEVEKVFPQSVVTDTGTGYKAVKYNALFAPLIESTKELYGMCLASEKRNDEQDRELASLREENKNLKSEVEDLKKRMERIEGLLLKSAK